MCSGLLNIPMLSPPSPNETPLNLHYFSKKPRSTWVWVPGHPQTRQRKMWEEPSNYFYHQKERFWLKESDFGLNKWWQACFWKKLPPKPESSIQLKSFIFWTVVDRDQSEASHFSKFAEGNSWKLAHFAVKTRGPRSSSRGSCLILTAPVNISNGKNAATEFPFETFCLPCFSHFSMVGDPSNITLGMPTPKNWNVFRRKRNEEITPEGGKR